MSGYARQFAPEAPSEIMISREEATFPSTDADSEGS